MTTFFTADTHFYHGNIIKYCNRPYSDAHEMTDDLVRRWNAKIGPDDLVYHLGDFAFAEANKVDALLNRLNGEKVVVLGNHDKVLRRNIELRKRHFKSAHELLEIYVQDPEHPDGKQHITLCHFPMLVWNKSHHGSWQLHGHCHGTLKYPIEGKIMDVGVDVHNFAPISYQEVKQVMAKKTFTGIDHHDKRRHPDGTSQA